ncbi:hypothetical protein Vi05172_g11259 [Venturia inaequalis]|nr:hypothetical protein Vi05172_g11259 [Venturia inaequalis]
MNRIAITGLKSSLHVNVTVSEVTAGVACHIASNNILTIPRLHTNQVAQDALRSASDKQVMSDVGSGFSAACCFSLVPAASSSAPHVWWRPTCDEIDGYYYQGFRAWWLGLMATKTVISET